EVIADGPPSELDDDALARIYGRPPDSKGAIVEAPSRRCAAASASAAERESTPAPVRKPAADWQLRPPFSKQMLAVTLLAAVLLGVSAKRTEIGRLFVLTSQWIAATVGLRPESEIGKGLGRFGKNAFPPVIAETTPINRIEGFDRERLPFLAHVERR